MTGVHVKKGSLDTEAKSLGIDAAPEPPEGTTPAGTIQWTEGRFITVCTSESGVVGLTAKGNWYHLGSENGFVIQNPSLVLYQENEILLLMIYIWGPLWSECVSPKFTCWNPNPQCDGVRRWSFAAWKIASI